MQFKDIGIGQSFVYNDYRYIKLPPTDIPWSVNQVNAFSPVMLGVHGYVLFHGSQEVEEFDANKRYKRQQNG